MLEKKILQNSKNLKKDELLEVIASEGVEYGIHCLVPEQPEKDRELEQDAEVEFKKLKDILYHYIDTFGQKYKNNYYKDLEKECPTSYNITILINTINLIIYDETKATLRVGDTAPMHAQI